MDESVVFQHRRVPAMNVDGDKEKRLKVGKVLSSDRDLS